MITKTEFVTFWWVALFTNIVMPEVLEMCKKMFANTLIAYCSCNTAVKMTVVGTITCRLLHER